MPLLGYAWQYSTSRQEILSIRLTRDSSMLVMYAEDLNPAKSSVTLQSTDRHELLCQKSMAFQPAYGCRKSTSATYIFYTPCPCVGPIISLPGISPPDFASRHAAEW